MKYVESEEKGSKGLRKLILSAIFYKLHPPTLRSRIRQDLKLEEALQSHYSKLQKAVIKEAVEIERSEKK